MFLTWKKTINWIFGSRQIISMISNWWKLFSFKEKTFEEMNQKLEWAENLWKQHFPQHPFHLEEDKNEILKKYRYCTWVWEEGGGGALWNFCYRLPSSHSFEENFDFRPKYDIFFRTCLGPLVIFINLKKIFQKKLTAPHSLKVFLIPYPRS